MKVLISGSFDPVTRGHEDLIRRTAVLFSEVRVVIFENSKKTPLFSTEARLGFLRALTKDLPNVTVDFSRSSVVAYAAEHGINCIVKGVRDGVDLDYEQDMAHLNRIAGGPETLFLPTDPVYSFIASSAVREFLLRGLPAEKLLPDAVADEVLAAYAEMKK